MASKVPQFGAWQGGDNYTVFFENARKNKNNGQMINPNDPQENPDMFPQNEARAQAPPRESRVDPRGKQSKAPQFGAWDSGESVGYTEYFENARKTKNDGPTTAEEDPQLNRDTRPLNKPEPQEARSKEPPAPSNGPRAQEGRSKVPQFGAWKEEENVAYTAYFDNARKTKNVGPSIEPQMNRDVIDRARPPSGATKARAEEQVGQGGVRFKSDQRGPTTKEEGQFRNVSRESVGSGKQTPVGQSPLHPKGGKPQSSRPAGRGSQTPDRGTTIPPFGVWNKDPSQAEGFTGTFTRAKEEKMTPLNKTTPGSYYHNQSNPEEKKGCFFGCFG